MRKDLTDTSIKKAVRDAISKGKRLTVFDTRVTGLAIRVTPSGHVSFYVMSRDPAGKQRWAEIRDGNAPATSLAQARELAPAGVANIKNGREAYPRIEPPAKLETYGEVVARFIKNYAQPRQRTWEETERVLKAVPWTERAFEGITAKDAIRHLDEIAEAGKMGKLKTTLAWLKVLWRWARVKHIVAINIMADMKADDFGATTQTRKRVFTDEELKAIWNATGPLSPQERGYLKLVTLLAPRSTALAEMRKDELDDLERPTLWTVPTKRTKTRKTREHEGRVYKIPLPPLARRVLVPLLKGEGDLVFPSANVPGEPISCGSQFRINVRAASGIPDWFAHAHRHTISTWLQNEGHDEYDRGLVLQHAGSGTVTAGYSHGHSTDRARALLEKWADHVASAVAPSGTELLA